MGAIERMGANATITMNPGLPQPSTPTQTQTQTTRAPDCVGQIKTTTLCNGSGGHQACVTSSYCSEYPLPTLTGPINPKDCPETTTVSRRCIGSGGQAGCQDVTVCAPYPITFTTTSKKPSCYDWRDTCISTTYNTKCDKAARVAPATAIDAIQTNVAAVATPRPTATKEQPIVYIAQEQAVPESSRNNSMAVATALTISQNPNPLNPWLAPRAGCQTSAVCVCKGPFTTCLTIKIEEFHEFSVVFKVKVEENDKTTCDFKKQCKGCKGGDEECKDGNKIRWEHNKVWYYSKKEDYTFFWHTGQYPVGQISMR